MATFALANAVLQEMQQRPAAAIVAGRQPAGLKLDYLLKADLPLAWADQRTALGF